MQEHVMNTEAFISLGLFTFTQEPTVMIHVGLKLELYLFDHTNVFRIKSQHKSLKNVVTS